MADRFADWDFLATPASAARRWPKEAPGPTTIAGRPAGPRAAAVFSTAVNLAGLPAIVVPAPILDGGLPVGLQLVGPLGSEERLLALAAAYEAAAPWARVAP
jgi:aspartyl-tRNA(Asn)/glutamyl-tRNA(Gln) amidotransferase subunit A